MSIFFLSYFIVPRLEHMFESSLKLSLHIPKWFNAFYVFKTFSFLLRVTYRCTYVALYLIVLIIQLTPSSWRQKIVLLVRGISCYSTVCGFRFPDQSGECTCPRCNLKVMSSVTRGSSCDHRHPVNSYSIVGWWHFFQASSLCLYIYYLVSLPSVSLTFSFDMLCLFYFIGISYAYTRHSYTPRFSSGSFFFIHRFTWLHWTQPSEFS